MNLNNLTQEIESITDGTIPGREKKSLTALVHAKRKLAPPIVEIGPLTEPTNLDELVGDIFSQNQSVVRELATAVDGLYINLRDLNNTRMADLENIEKQISTTADAVQGVTSLIVGTDQYVWITESFNSTDFIDPSATTALIDTDSGAATLNPKQLNRVPITIDIAKGDIVGIPGCNFLILDNKNRGNTSTEPQPTLETSTVSNINNIADGSNQTWFEVERNFVPKKQSLVRYGRAWVYQLGAPTQDVQAATGGFDWKGIVTYPDGSKDSGEDGSGVSLVEFIDGVDPSAFQKYDATLTINIKPTTPQSLSNINIVPFIRAGMGDMYIVSIDAICGDQTIPIAKNVGVTNQQTSVTALESQVYKRTGSSSIGAIYTVPTDRVVDALKIVIGGKAIRAPYGLAHKFKEQQIQNRTQRNYLFFSSVDKSTYWSRIASSSTPPSIVVKNKNPDLLGSATPIVQDLATTLRNVPIIGEVLAVNDLIKAAFGASTTKTTLSSISAYDVFNGYRAYIALREININRVIYDTSSTIQTVKRSFAKPVTKVGIISSVNFPANWDNGTYVTYYLSEDGINWTSVQTLSEITLGQSYTMSKPSTDIWLRIVVRGNSGDSYRTPSITNVTLQGVPVSR